MIFSLSGIAKHIGPNFAVIEVGGIGYQVFTTSDTLASMSAPARRPVLHSFNDGGSFSEGGNGSIELWVSHLITDSSQTLFGFQTLEQRQFFEQLLTVSGVGGKTAINIMGLAPLSDLQSAIRSGDPSMLTRVSGVGKKTAERIIVELKEKLGAGEAMNATHGDAFEALLSLGYNAHDIREALRTVTSTQTEIIIKEALEKIGSARK